MLAAMGIRAIGYEGNFSFCHDLGVGSPCDRDSNYAGLVTSSVHLILEV